MSLVENLALIDRLIADLGDEPPSEAKLHKVRDEICRTIQSMCSGRSDIVGESLSDKLERATNDPQARRDAALLVLRCLVRQESYRRMMIRTSYSAEWWLSSSKERRTFRSFLISKVKSKLSINSMSSSPSIVIVGIS